MKREGVGASGGGKHLVATALTANESSGAGDGVLERIRRHLQGKGTDALVEMILDLAERDAALLRSLDMAAVSTTDDDDTVFTRIRKGLDDATYTGGFVEYREAAAWANGVDAILDRIAELVADGRGTVALRLIDHAFDRIEAALNEIDDSSGHAGGLLERAHDIHLAACRATRPDAATLAGDLFACEVEGNWDTFHNSATLYADVLGEPGLAEFRRLATAAWEKIPPLVGKDKTKDDYSTGRMRLATMMDAFAERDGDIEARIAIRARTLTSPWHYLDLARFCLSQGREAEALRRAQEGLWLFEDGPPDERLVTFAADLALRSGQTAEAEALLWRAFERQPSLGLYQHLRQHGGEAARDRAIAALRARLTTSPPGMWCAPMAPATRCRIRSPWSAKPATRARRWPSTPRGSISW
ncbi:MAG: DUF6880 family protein [Rhodospirillaceae bacterium]